MRFLSYLCSIFCSSKKETMPVTSSTKKTVFSDKLFFQLLKEQILEGSDRQISSRIREKIINFVSTERKPTEVYDFMVEISNEPLTEVSSFVKQVCNVGEFYQRPQSE